MGCQDSAGLWGLIVERRGRVKVRQVVCVFLTPTQHSCACNCLICVYARVLTATQLTPLPTRRDHCVSVHRSALMYIPVVPPASAVCLPSPILIIACAHTHASLSFLPLFFFFFLLLTF